MKKLSIFLVCISMFTLSAQAQPSDSKMDKSGDLPQQTLLMCNMPTPCPMNPPQGMAMPGGPMAPMGMMCPMKDEMPSLIEIMKLQQKLIAGVKPAEKKELMGQIDKKIAQLEGATAAMQKMQMPCMMPPPPPAPAGK